MLAGLLARHPDELRADFQRYYALDLDGLGVAYTMHHAAALARCLPRDSATWRAERPELEWGPAEYLLASIDYTLRILAWQNTENGHKGVNAPKRPMTPMDYARVARKAEETDMEWIAEQLGLDARDGGGDG